MCWGVTDPTEAGAHGPKLRIHLAQGAGKEVSEGPSSLKVTATGLCLHAETSEAS